MLKLKILFVIFIAFFLIVFIRFDAQAAGSASIYPVPSTGNFKLNDIFTVDIIIDGNGTQFNAATAQLNLSSNLIIEDLTLGNCDFAFVDTPSAKKPSFTGVLLGSSSKKCTVLKLTLRSAGEGTGNLSLSSGSIKSYPKANEILSLLGTATYTIGSSTSKSTTQQDSHANPAIPPTLPSENQIEPSSYTVIFTVKDDSNNPLKDAVAVLTPQTPDKATMPNQTVLSASDGTAKFTNVPKGIYKVNTVYKNKKLGENILAINGPSKTIALGIQAKKTFNYLWFLLIIPFVLIIAFIIFAVIKRRTLPHITNVSQ